MTNHEVRWTRANGEVFTVMMNATRIGEGGEAHLEAIVLDVSDLERAQEALRERELQLRNLGDNLPDGVIYRVVRRLDGSNYFPYMSAGLERAFGMRREEALTNPTALYGLILPEDLPRIRAAGDESIQTGKPFLVDYRLRAPGGEYRWMHVRANPRRLEDGSTLWDAVALDITDRKRAEEALRERERQLQTVTDRLRRSEERYRLLFERSFVGIFRTRADGILVECNDVFARILGYEGAADARGHSVLDHYIRPADRDLIVAKISAGEDVVDAELVGRRRNGSLVPVSMSVRRLVEDEGVIHEGILVDLTERKRAEEATTLRSVAELANAAAHEINNPLTVIVGQLELISRGDDVAGRIVDAQTAADRIRDIVKHMVRITHLEPSPGWSPDLPRMLDIRRSAAGPDDPPPDRHAP